ncbi:ribonuclease HII [Pseudoloma neurophilia]|uniref:Ribonuclease n=1 Tax=Pseudoloma neurophilia TaxID=146866 RepID=A0A0R0M6M5_9MICR|nr:ribonuclease HII [Pseudoloma neurophilia]
MATKKKKTVIKLLDFSDNYTTNHNQLYISTDFNEKLTKLKEKCIKEKKELFVGIDEAGRGPVVGPLVFGLVVFSGSDKFKAQFEKNSHTFIDEIKIKDSKQMTKDERNKSANFLNEHFPCATLALDAQFITTEMDRSSLNDICLWAVIKLLENFKNNFSDETFNEKITQMKGIRTMSGAVFTKNRTITQTKLPTDQTVFTINVIIDSLGNSATPLLTLQSRFPKYKFNILPKADSLHQVVSAASIVAKVKRDALLDRIIKTHILEGCLCLEKKVELKRNVSYTVFKNDNTVDEEKIFDTKELQKSKLRCLLNCNGYPSCPYVKKYLTEFPNCPSIRFKWSTVKKVFVTGRRLKGFRNVYFKE